MRSDADFMVYVAARWPALVREAVLLGVRPGDAADATADALARCRRGWERRSREEDVDALVREELMAAAARRPRTAEAGREERARELLVLAPPTLEELRHQESRRNRAILVRAARIGVPLLLVGVGGGAYLSTRGDHDPAPPTPSVPDHAAVSREENPAPGVVWYADGRLHLDHTVLAVEGLRSMTRIGPGVVYDDEDGRVVYAADDGVLDVLGRHRPDAAAAATDESGWAAWVDTSSDEARLVVKEAATGREVATAVVPVESRVIAVDGDTVFFQTATGIFTLRPGGPPSVDPPTIDPAAAGELLDVRSRIRAYQIDPGTIQVVQSAFDAEFDLSGQGARLAPDGSSVATRLPGSEAVAVYDTRSGEPLPYAVAPGDHVVAFAPGNRLTIASIVAPNGSAAPSHDLELRTCDLETAVCTVVTRIPNTGGTPVLAR